MTITQEIYNLMCPNIECGLEKITINCDDVELAQCPLCKTELFGETELKKFEPEPDPDELREIESWNRDMDEFHRQAYGERTYEEGGIQDFTGHSSRFNKSGEPLW
mgnify:CR=1 FL=1